MSQTAVIAQDGARTVTIVRDGQAVHIVAHHATLDDIASTLHKELGLNLLIDTPPRAESVDLKADGTLEEVLKVLCDKFDLTRQQKGSLHLFRQRFAQFETRAQMELEEMRAVTRDFVKVFNAVSPTLGFDDPTKRFQLLANSLSPPQIAALRQRSFVPMSQLPEVQIASMQIAMLDIYVGMQARAWKQLADQFERLPTSYLEIRESPHFYNRRAKVPESANDGVPHEWQLTWVTPLPGGWEHTLTVSVPPPPGSVATPAGQASTDRLSDQKTTEADPSRTQMSLADSYSFGQTTVAQLVKAVTEHSGRKCVATPATAHRALLVYSETVPVLKLLGAVAEMDGWKLVEDENGTISVERTRQRLPRDLSEVPAAFQRCLPPELLRYLGFGVPIAELPVIIDPKQIAQLQPLKTSPFYPRFLAIMTTYWKLKPFEDRAKEELRRLAAAHSELYQGKRMKFEDLNSEARHSLVELLTTTALVTLNESDADFFTNELAPYQRDIRTAEIQLLKDGGLSIGVSGGMGKAFMSGLSDPNPFSDLKAQRRP